jgi:hypothetical protein
VPSFAQCTPGNIIVDGGFETTNPSTGVNPFWPATSTQYGTPFCSLTRCGNGVDTAAPRTGTFWSWLGGVSYAPETATMSQAVTFPATASSVTLNFYLRIGAVTSPFTDVVNVKVDGATQATFTEPSVAEGGYTLRSINLTAFANGASHTVLFEYIKGSNGGAADNTANFSIDDVTLDVGCGAAVAAKDSVGLYDAATQTFYLRNANSNGPANIAFGYGAAGDIPITGDWNGDGIDTIGVYRPSTGFFYLRNTNSAGPADIAFQFGVGGAVPLSGDWNGDGIDTIGLYDPATGTFFLRNSNSAGPADIVFTLGGGGAGVIPVVGDWNGDGVDTIGLYVVATGVFFLRNTNSSGSADLTFTFGMGGASIKPITGDWNNDGTRTIGLYNSSTGAFFLRNANANGPADITFSFGSGGAKPLAGDWDNLP